MANPLAVRAKATFVYATGEPIIHIEAPVPPGQVQSFDVARDMISLPGEPGTGRVQGRVEIEVHIASVSKVEALLIKRSLRTFLPLSLEVMENGRTLSTPSNVEVIIKILDS
jgi:hypothetical protein